MDRTRARSFTTSTLLTTCPSKPCVPLRRGRMRTYWPSGSGRFSNLATSLSPHGADIEWKQKPYTHRITWTSSRTRGGIGSVTWHERRQMKNRRGTNANLPTYWGYPFVNTSTQWGLHAEPDQLASGNDGCQGFLRPCDVKSERVRRRSWRWRVVRR